MEDLAFGKFYDAMKDGTIAVLCCRAMWKGACQRKEHAKTLVVAAGDALFCYFPYYLDPSAKSTTTHASPCTTRAQAILHST